MKKTLFMPQLKDTERERIEEVRFFLVVSKLTKLARSIGAEDEYALLKNLIELTQTNETLLTLAANSIITLPCKPSDIEVAVAAKYTGLPYRFIEKRLMHSRKFYDLIQQYLREREVNILFPRLQEELVAEVVKFNKLVRERFCPIIFLLNNDIMEETDLWNS